MTSIEYVSSKLKLSTDADGVETDVIDGERVVYLLYFDKSVGIDWLVAELGKVMADIDIGMQRWKIEPATDNRSGYIVSVRETERRPDLDSDQESLHYFEK